MISHIYLNIFKYLFGVGILGLILSSLIILIILNIINPKIEEMRKKSLRDQHNHNVSRLGGVGLFWGFFISLIFIWFIQVQQQSLSLELLQQNRLVGFCIGGLLAWLLGFVDDCIDLRARWKLVGQLFLSLLAINLGFEIKTIQIPILQIVDLGPWSWIITIFWIVGLINAINLIDGLDGLAGGLAITALVFFGTICWWQNQYSILIIIFLLIGVTIGFWLFNKPKASIFMGDSGSMFLGYSLALLSIWVTDIPGRGPSSLPVLILAIPILDTAFSFFRRFFKGIPFYSADKDHLHHRLVYKGFSESQAILIIILFSILFGLLSLMAFKIYNFLGFSFLIGIALSFIILHWLGYEVIRKPYNSIREQNDLRKRRNLMIALGEQIEDFFEKDPDRESIIRSYIFWIKLADVTWFEIKNNQEIISNSGKKLINNKIISFEHNSYELKLALNDSSWKIDSDYKEQLLELVSLALIKRLENFD